MKLTVASSLITHSQGSIAAAYPVLEAHEISGIVVVIYDYMVFPKDAPARNLFGYSVTTGEQLWRVADVALGGTGAYTQLISEEPLVVGNFSGFDCRVDVRTGSVISKIFRK
ncbi:hypothetical protein [Pseudomonas sp. MYb118]|uniref:hypothetical protein n=1 Tax=Pseudomonas sp. MYb118 TaxID=1848720 RepID=UPI0034CEE488